MHLKVSSTKWQLQSDEMRQTYQQNIFFGFGATDGLLAFYLVIYSQVYYSKQQFGMFGIAEGIFVLNLTCLYISAYINLF